jgi:Prolyl oligopeptidase family
MLSYSPYDNVSQKSYPAIYVSAGFYDSQVSYAEPAKWVARLRANKTDFHDLVLRTDMESGHQGHSGRGGTASENAVVSCFVRNLATKFVLESHRKLDSVEAIGAEIVDEISVFCYLVRIDAEMFNDDLLDPLANITHRFPTYILRRRLVLK